MVNDIENENNNYLFELISLKEKINLAILIVTKCNDLDIELKKVIDNKWDEHFDIESVNNLRISLSKFLGK